MGESISFFETVKEAFSLKKTDPSQYSPLTLSYIGDNVYELINRSIAVFKADRQVYKLHKECSGRANAVVQAQMAHFLKDVFTEDEKKIFARGKNATVNTKAKNSTITEYHLATGLEAVIGYLYMNEEYDRIILLLKTGWEALGLI